MDAYEGKVNKWQILKDGAPLVEGSGSAVSIDGSTLAEGTYTVLFEVENYANQIAFVQRDFAIVKHPIEDGMYE